MSQVIREPVYISANNKGADQTLAGLCSRADWFESYLVKNPEDMFSPDETQMVLKGCKTKFPKKWQLY